MKTLPFLLLSTTLLGQQPQGEPRIPQQPVPGQLLKTPAPPTVRNAPATTTQVAPQTLPQPNKPLPAAVKKAIDAAVVTTVQFDQPTADGPLWALGADYKASFDAAQWSFIARPTANAERSQPMTFRLTTAKVGEHSIDLGAGATAQREGNRVQLQHGGVLETLELRPHAIEQSFTFTSLPQRGELVLDIGIDSELSGQVANTGLRFVSDWTQVAYTGAVAIDADGNRIDAATHLVDGHIEIRVPAEFVATASLPLVIDPLVSSGIVVTGGNDVGNPDVVYAPGSNEWHVTYQQIFAAGDWDCYVMRMDANFAPIGTPVAIDYTSNSFSRPRIAHLTNSNLSLVVGEVRYGTNPVKVTGRVINNAGTMTTGQFDIATDAVDNLVPDVGADPYPGIGYFTVVWEHAYSSTDHDIYARQVTSTGTLVGTTPIYVQANTAYQANPSISKSDGGPSFGDQRYAIVYQEQSPALDWDIYGSLMTWNGVIVQVNGANTFPIDTSTASNVLPSVSSPTLSSTTGVRNFLCVYESVWSNAGDIEMSAFDGSGTVLARGNVVALEGNLVRLSWPQHFPSVDSDGTRFAVAYHENFNNSTDLDARVTTVAYGSGQLFAMDSAAPGFSGNPEFNVQIASRYATNTLQDQGYATVNDRDSTTLAIEGDRYDSAPSGLALLRSTGCGGGVFLTSSGDPLPGNTVTMSITHTAPIAGFVAGAAASASLPGCSCVIGAESSLIQVGNTLSITIPNTPTIIGAGVSVQGWMLGAPGTSCLFDINLSDTIDITVR